MPPLPAPPASPPLRGARRVGLAVAAAALLACAASCSGKAGFARSPEEAYLQLLEAADAGDAARLFDDLDTPTQWAIETVHKSQREMRKLVLESYPPAERDQALARIPAACEEDLARPRRYFRRLDDSAAILADVKRRLYVGTGQPVGSVRKKEGIAEVWREGGSIFHFYRDETGRWGYMELRDGWERSKERALHELDVVRDNAALYRRRAGAKPTETPPPAAADAGQKGTSG